MLRNLAKLILGIMLFWIVAASSDLYAKSNQQGTTVCMQEWGRYVDVVSKALKSEDLESKSGKYFILFSGPDGEIYNCLEKNLPSENVMKRVVFWGRAVARLEDQLEKPEAEKAALQPVIVE